MSANVKRLVCAFSFVMAFVPIVCLLLPRDALTFRQLTVLWISTAVAGMICAVLGGVHPKQSTSSPQFCAGLERRFSPVTWLFAHDVRGPLGLMAMSNSFKPWSNQRQVLWGVGVLGLLLVAFGLFIGWFLQGGFGPGSKGLFFDLRDIIGTILVSILFIYYIIVAHRVWTRKLWVAGIVIHCTVFLFLFKLLLSDGRSLLLLPFFLIGQITWILHARRSAL